MPVKGISPGCSMGCAHSFILKLGNFHFRLDGTTCSDKAFLPKISLALGKLYTAKIDAKTNMAEIPRSLFFQGNFTINVIFFVPSSVIYLRMCSSDSDSDQILMTVMITTMSLKCTSMFYSSISLHSKTIQAKRLFFLFLLFL